MTFVGDCVKSPAKVRKNRIHYVLTRVRDKKMGNIILSAFFFNEL